MDNKKKSIIVISIGLFVLLNLSGSMIIIKTLSKTVDVVVVSKMMLPRERITKDHIMTIAMPQNTIPNNVLIKEEDIIGKVVAFETHLFRGMFFFEDAIEDMDETKDAPLLRLKANQVAVSLGVDVVKSLGNTLLPGQYVDIVFTLSIRNENPLVDTIFFDVRVLAVKDRYGLDMHDPKSQRTPHVILLAIDHQHVNDFYLALRKGQMDLVPIANQSMIDHEARIHSESIIWGKLYE